MGKAARLITALALCLAAATAGAAGRSDTLTLGPPCIEDADGHRRTCPGPGGWALVVAGDLTETASIVLGARDWPQRAALARLAAEVEAGLPVAARVAEAGTAAGFVAPTDRVLWIVGGADAGPRALSFTVTLAEMDLGGEGAATDSRALRLVYALDPVRGPCLAAVIRDEDRLDRRADGAIGRWPSDLALALDLVEGLGDCWAARALGAD